MSLHQSILDMAAKLGCEVDDVLYIIANVQLLFGVFLTCAVYLLIKAVHALKLHFQKSPKQH